MFGKGFVTILSMLLAGGAAIAQAPAQAPSSTTAAQPGCELPAMADSCELNQVAGSNLVTVPVKIEGKPKELLLAIGTNVSEVSSAAVKELKLVEGIKRTETFQTGPAYWPDDTSLRNELEGMTLQT